MQLQFEYNRNEYQQGGIIYYDAQQKKIINLGQSKSIHFANNMVLESVHFVNDPTKISEKSIILTPESQVRDMRGHNHGVISENGIMYNLDSFDLKSFCQAITNGDDGYVMIDEKNGDYLIALEAAASVGHLFHDNPLYEHIIRGTVDNPQIINLWDVLFSIPDFKEQMKYLRSLSFVRGNIKSIQAVAEQILQTAPKKTGFDLLSQEEQIEAFIKFSKQAVGQEKEAVTDEMLDQLKQSTAYQRSIQQLKDHGFGISKTQQFNVLQATGYLGQLNPDQSVIYNLSDMGAGKTMMTVQSIYLMDLLLAQQFEQQPGFENLKNISSSFRVPSKNLLAPELSVESSWVDTFKLFYDVKPLSDDRYQLQFTLNGNQYQSILNVVGFTVANSGIKTTGKFPALQTNHEYLIIDEVHQIVQRKVNTSKFFAANVEPAHDYQSFVLSGTLSNLTTEQWYHYLKMMKLSFNQSQLDGTSPRDQQMNAGNEYEDLKLKVKEGSENIRTQQHRYFDSNIQLTTIPLPNPKHTNEKGLFDILYAPQILSIPDWATDKTHISDVLAQNDYSLSNQPELLTAPNFELFYQLVGNCAITAESTQVAEELFGDQQVQHKANVINVSSALSTNDIKLLSTIHNVTLDYDIYKSKSIAEKINNAVLNLNDGLASTDLYQVINRAANHNTKFLQYLSTLDVNLLQELPKSALIQQPKLEQTEKFAILKDLLAKEPKETFLIVVNDISATKKLSEALGIKSLTKQDLKNPLNYQTILDTLFEEQSIVVVPQAMIKSSLDLVQANRLIQYQLNTEISDIIQTQNRINRIGQTRETKAFYIATDQLQKNVIDLFLATYQNIRVAHKGIVELFVNLDSQVNVINDYIGKAMDKLTGDNEENTEVTDEMEAASNDVIDDQPNIIDDLIVNASHHQLQFVK